MKIFRNIWLKFSGMIQRIAQLVVDDLITVYAAQASFFAIISVVPFSSLAVSVISLFVPSDVLSILQGTQLPYSTLSFIGTLLDDIRNAPAVPLLSISAIVSLWTASKGTSAILSGVATVYHAPFSSNFVSHRLKSLLTTLVLIALILAIVILFLFGDLVGDLLQLQPVTDVLMDWRIPLFFLFMSIVFTSIYAYAARRSAYVKKKYWAHLPGALFASIGWVAFSQLYSLYITHFPNASYLYGSLGAVCLMMLWLYACMIILLLGAEINKVIYLTFLRWRQKRTAAPPA